MLYIPLDISNIPIVTAFSICDKFKFEIKMVGISENMTVYENIYASVFNVPYILTDNNSKVEYIL